MARMIPTTSEILIWMMKRIAEAEDLDVVDAASGVEQEVADRHREVEADDRADGDREDRPEQPRAQLAEVVDERHDRLVAGRGGRRWERSRIGRRGDVR